MAITAPTLVRLVKSEFVFGTTPEGKKRGNALGQAFHNPTTSQMVQALGSDFDPDTFEGDTRIDTVGDKEVTRYLTPREWQSLIYLSPFARGSSWRKAGRAPEPPKYEDYSGSDGSWDDEVWPHGKKAMPGDIAYREAMESYNERYPEWESGIIPDVIDTIAHEMGHRATLSEISGIGRRSGAFGSQGRFDTDEYRHYHNQQGKRIDEKSTEMAHLMDDPVALRRLLTSPSKSSDAPRFMPMRTDRSAWDERAAYTAEYPHNPGYAMGRWLMHDNVEQQVRRKALQEVAAAQKKWGMDSIDAKQMIRDLDPKNRWGNTAETKRIMGLPPERRPPIGHDEGWKPTPEPEAERLLLPPQERIYQNLRNAILGQSADTMAQSGMFLTDPEGYMNRDSRYAERLKGAKSLGSEALTALDAHFKDIQGGKASVPKTVMDLPESLRGEIGRLELRRILANQVADQYHFMDEDAEWENPDDAMTRGWSPKMLFDIPANANLAEMRGRKGSRGMYQGNPHQPNIREYPDHFTDEEREKYGQVFDKYTEMMNKWGRHEGYGGDWNDAFGSAPYHHNEHIKELMQRDEDEHGIRAWWPDEFEDYPPGPHLKAFYDEMAAKKIGYQKEIDDLAASLGITDHYSVNRQQTYPKEMLDDFDFVEFDPDNPEHKKAYDWWTKEAQRSHYNYDELSSQGQNFAESLFPSLHYGLIPKQALEWNEGSGSYHDRGRYKTPETKREWLAGRYTDDKDKPQTSHIENLQGIAQDPFRRIPSYHRHEDDVMPESRFKPHPLAGKPIMQYGNVGLKNPKAWELLS